MSDALEVAATTENAATVNRGLSRQVSIRAVNVNILMSNRLLRAVFL